MSQDPQAQPPGPPSPWLRYLQAGILPRLAVIILGVPCLFIITLRGGAFFLLLVNLIIFLGLREFYQMLATKGYRPYQMLGITCGLAVSWYVYSGGVAISLVMTAILLSVMIRELFRRDMSHALTHIAVTVLGVLYVGWLGSHLVMLRELPAEVGVPDVVGARLVFFVAAVTWAGDIAAYVIGIALGSHPLLPRISPKKTVEGAVGGLLGSVAAGLFCAWNFLPVLTPTHGALLGLCGGIAGQLGDLVESLLKRDVGIKDSAGLIPGHGGVLDRFDSLLFSGPLLYYYFRFFVV
ncbi:MAG: phosphatidate cytidylyltransferase [bacterium]